MFFTSAEHLPGLDTLSKEDMVRVIIVAMVILVFLVILNIMNNKA